MNPDTDKNRNYYQRMYNQIHASDKLKERLIHMKTNTEQSSIQMPHSTETSVYFTDKNPGILFSVSLPDSTGSLPNHFSFHSRRCLSVVSCVISA